MARIKTLQTLFKRYRRPGDIVFAWFVFLVSLFLLSQIASETTWKAGSNLFAQPRFWPAVSLGGMVIFAGLHLLGSALSERIEGRWSEVLLWLSSIEYAAWFVVYALAVPYTGYLLSTIVFAVVLTLRVGYRSKGIVIGAGVTGLFIVLLFKTMLKVNIPSGTIYDHLPLALRQFMLTYF